MKLNFNARGWWLGHNDIDMAEPHLKDVYADQTRASHSLEQQWNMFHSCCEHDSHALFTIPFHQIEKCDGNSKRKGNLPWTEKLF
jgi:hypothetical protein